MPHRIPRSVLRTLPVLAIGLAAAAAPPASQWRVVGTATTQGDEFGFANGIDGDTAIVGAPYADGPAGFRQGEAYAFVRAGASWTEQDRITPLDAAENAQFGTSADVDGDTAVVGAIRDSQAGAVAGAAYVFVRNGSVWAQQQKLVADDAGPGDQLGEDVAIDGDTVVAGARFHDAAGTNAGAAYVWVRSGSAWTLQQKLVADDAAPSDNFGVTVAIDGDTIVVGAPYGGPQDSGAAYVFVRSGGAWTQQQRLVQGTVLDQAFGYEVAVSGDTALVGAPDRDDGVADPGAAYAFVRSGGSWSEQQRIVQDDPGPHDRFGRCLALDGDLAVVAAPLDDDRGDDAGAVYVLQRSGASWTKLHKLTAIDGAEGAKFGLFVSMSGTTAVAGAPLHADPAQDAGSAYFLQNLTATGGGGGGGGGGGDPVEVVDAFLLPRTVSIRTGPRGQILLTGTLDTGGETPALGGAARFDVGSVDMIVPRLAQKGRTMAYSGHGVRLTLTASPHGSSNVKLKLKYTGDLSDRVTTDGDETFRYRGAEVDGSGTVRMERGRFVLARSRAGVSDPPLFPHRAGATLGGAGRDTLQLVLGYDSDGAVPGAAPDLRLQFGGYALDVPAASFTRTGDVWNATAGTVKIALDGAKGTVTVKGSQLTLGEFSQGANTVAIQLTLGGVTRDVEIRMGRRGARLLY